MAVVDNYAQCLSREIHPLPALGSRGRPAEQKKSSDRAALENVPTRSSAPMPIPGPDNTNSLPLNFIVFCADDDSVLLSLLSVIANVVTQKPNPGDLGVLAARDVLTRLASLQFFCRIVCANDVLTTSSCMYYDVVDHCRKTNTTRHDNHRKNLESPPVVQGLILLMMMIVIIFIGVILCLFLEPRECGGDEEETESGRFGAFK